MRADDDLAGRCAPIELLVVDVDGVLTDGVIALDDRGVEARQVCFVGDDLADLPVLGAVGLAACPADAAPEVRLGAHLVTRADGGRGAVREVVETILKHQGSWDGLVGRYRTPA